MLHDISYVNLLMLLATIPDSGFKKEDEEEEKVEQIAGEEYQKWFN